MKLALNPIVVNIEAADPLLSDRAGLQYFLKVMVPEFYLSNTFNELVELEGSEIPPEEMSQGTIYRGAYFELEEQLEGLLTRTAPEFGQDGIRACEGLVSPYYLTARIENYGEPIYEKTFPVDYVIKAGIDEADFAEYKDYFFTNYIQGTRFLTWAEDHKRVHPEQPEFLYWLTNVSPLPSQINLRCRVEYAEESDESPFTVASLDNVASMTVYCAAVGYQALGLESKEGQVIGWRVWLEDANGARLTEDRSYWLDQQYRRNVRFIVFANSLGGFDTLYLTGQGEESLNVVRSISERYPDYNYLPSYAETVINATAGERQLTVSTGWLSKAQREYLQELLLSKEIYYVSERAFLPLVPSFDSVRPVVDDEDLIGRTLTFRFTNPKRNFSKLPILTGVIPRATAWRPKAVACLLDANGKRTGKKAATLIEKYYLDDNSRVAEAPIKPNIPGTEGYIPPVVSPDCAVTPYLNTVISKQGTYTKQGCSTGQVGSTALITIAAETYGSEISQADAQAKAEAAWQALNTQAYANTNGACVFSPETYSYNVPADHFHYRVSDASKISIQYGSPTEQSMGNGWTVQGSGGSYIFPQFSNDLNFPVSVLYYDFWTLLIKGTRNTQRRVKIYNNGVLMINRLITINGEGFEQINVFYNNGASVFTPVSGDKLYISVENP
ncbi:DUF5977 domain-containing protein [Larkinella arboricola]|uniref:DUF5977 domain-containing protein n=1 Tax=Larkinella arboricola TaxID=643671 RepID=UPI001B869AF8|nr:DUF5977 domain-containing protein [Larkinella arboricola]